MSCAAKSMMADCHEFSFATKTNSVALLQQLSGTPKLAGVTPASSLETRPIPDKVSSGITQIDALTGGFPRGRLTEIFGPDSSGRTSLLLSSLASGTQRGEVCTLIDVNDALDPHSAAAAGVDLGRLLWIRCGLNSKPSGSLRKPRNVASREEWERRRREDPVEQALRATDLLLQSSGFGLVAIDLAGVPLKTARRIPLTTWFRFRRAVENTSTILLVIGAHACAQSCASLSLQLRGTDRSSGLGSGSSVFSGEQSGDGIDGCIEPWPSHAKLLSGMQIRAEVLHTRIERKAAQSVAATFQAKTAWTG